MNVILTPVYKAWERTKQCIDHIDQNTVGDFLHILILDSVDAPEDVMNHHARENRLWLKFDDGLPPEQHRMCLTKALQKGWDWLGKAEDVKHLFVVETDVMVPKDWNMDLVVLSQLISVPWETIDAIAVDENNQVTYPSRDHNVRRGHATFGGHEFEIVQYGDWNAVMLSPTALDDLKHGVWRFDDVPTHHDILLSRAFRDRRGYEKENWDPPLFFRTQEVRAIHYANSSRSELPEGLKTPSNPR